jgi:hypothetical protein
VDFWDLTKLMVRRWYVSVPAFLVAIGATITVGLQVEPDYVATSYVQLVGPAVTPKANDETKATARNPWLDLGLASLSKAGIISVTDQRVVKALKDSGYTDDYTVTMDSQQPIVIFKRFTDSTTTLQKEYGAPQDQMITARRLDLGDNVKESTSKVKRALIAIGGVGLLLAVALTVIADVWLRRRKKPADEESTADQPAIGSLAGSRHISAPVSPASGSGPPSTVTPPRSGGQYSSRSTTGGPGTGGPATNLANSVDGEKTAIIKIPPGEETVVLPGPRQKQSGRSNGSKPS